MVIYSSVFCLINDFYSHNFYKDPEYNDFLYSFLFCEYDESFLFTLEKTDLVALIDRGCPGYDLDYISEKLDDLLSLLIKLHKNNLICYSRRVKFRFPWQEKTYVSTTWEEYEEFFYERVGVPVEFDKSCAPYLTLQLQLKEIDVGFVTK